MLALAVDVEVCIELKKKNKRYLNEVLNKMPNGYASLSAMPNITMEFAIFLGVIA